MKVVIHNHLPKRTRDASAEELDKKIRELTIKANKSDDKQEKKELARQIEALKRQRG